LKIQGKSLLDRQQEEISTEKALKDLGDFSQIKALQFKERTEFIDQTLWTCFSSSVLKLSQLQVLFIYIQMTTSLEMSPSENSFIDFFSGLKNLQNLRVFTFHIYYHYHYHKDFKRVKGNKIFLTVCEALQDLKGLEKLDFSYPWIPSPNSDIAGLTNVLTSLRKLESFSFHFDVNRSVQPIENDVFMGFVKALCCLKAMKNFTINLDMKEISEISEEIVLLLFRCFKERKVEFSLTLSSRDIDWKAAKRLTQLSNRIIVCPQKK